MSVCEGGLELLSLFDTTNSSKFSETTRSLSVMRHWNRAHNKYLDHHPSSATAQIPQKVLYYRKKYYYYLQFICFLLIR